MTRSFQGQVLRVAYRHSLDRLGLTRDLRRSTGPFHRPLVLALQHRIGSMSLDHAVGQRFAQTKQLFAIPAIFEARQNRPARPVFLPGWDPARPAAGGRGRNPTRPPRCYPDTPTRPPFIPAPTV